MNAQIKLEKEAALGNVIVPVIARLGPDGATIQVDSALQKFVAWDDMLDVWHLAEEFALVRVFEFQVVVELLGQSYRMKDMVQ